MSAPVNVPLRDLLAECQRWAGDALPGHLHEQIDEALGAPWAAPQPSLLFTTSQSISDARINGRFVSVGRGRVVTSKAYRGFKENFAARVAETLDGAAPLLGPVAVTVHMPWPRTCQQEHNEGIPLGDVDSPLKCILDALKFDPKTKTGGAFVDDSQVVTLVASKWPRPEQLIVEVTPCTL